MAFKINLEKMKTKNKWPKIEDEAFAYFEVDGEEYSFPANLMDEVKVTPSAFSTAIVGLLKEARQLNISVDESQTKSFTKIIDKAPFKKPSDMQDYLRFSLANISNIKNISIYDKAFEKREELESTKEELSAAFIERFRRAPRVLDGIAIATVAYDLNVNDIVSNFSVEKMQACLERYSPAQAAVLIAETPSNLPSDFFNSEASECALKCYTKFLSKGEDCYRKGGDWICSHPDTSVKVLKKVAKLAKNLDIDENTTVDAIKSQTAENSAVSEVSAIEKAYKKPGFKFSKCEFDLKFSDTRSHGYRAEILRPGDTRMVYLGYMTHCCQKLGGVGESAMMHGLLNPKAGFWVLTSENTGRVVAQAEIWEVENDENSLVFDNIEFENDADISLYREAIADWLKESPYENIYMGAGYNQLAYSGNFRRLDEALKPWVTPYEIYVLSYEDDSQVEGALCEIKSVEKAAKILEEGRATYFDYVYCDSEQCTLVMKEHGELEPYFNGVDNAFGRNSDGEEEYEEEFDEEYEEEFD